MQHNTETGSPVTWGEHVTDEQYGAAPTQHELSHAHTRAPRPMFMGSRVTSGWLAPLAHASRRPGRFANHATAVA